MSDCFSASALTGISCVVTRPIGTAATLLSDVRARGGVGVALPGLTLRETADAPTARSLLRAAVGADCCIFTSPSAVRFAFRLEPGLQMGREAGVFGVGGGTLLELSRHGIRASAPTERSDSEGLLALPGLADVRGKHVALIGAAGGRELIAPTLRERGAQVESIHVYERGRPRLNRRHFEALARATDPLITLISSGEALLNLVALLPPPLLARLRHQILIVSSARLAVIAEDHDFEDVRVAASASADDLLDAACKALAQHRL